MSHPTVHPSVLDAIREAEEDSLKMLKDAETRTKGCFERLRAAIQTALTPQDEGPSPVQEYSNFGDDHLPVRHRKKQQWLSAPHITPTDALEPAPTALWEAEPRHVFFPPTLHAANEASLGQSDPPPSPPRVVSTSNETVTVAGSSVFLYGEQTFVQGNIPRNMGQVNAAAHGEVRLTTEEPHAFDVSDVSESTFDSSRGSVPSAFGPSVSHPDVSSQDGHPEQTERRTSHHTNGNRGEPRGQGTAQFEDEYRLMRVSDDPEHPSISIPNAFSAGLYDQYPSGPLGGAAPAREDAVRAAPPSPALSFVESSSPPLNSAVPAFVEAQTAGPSRSHIAGKKRSRSEKEREEAEQISNYSFGKPTAILSETTEERPAQRQRISDGPVFEGTQMAQQPGSVINQTGAPEFRPPSEHPQETVPTLSPGHPPRPYHPALPSPPVPAPQNPQIPPVPTDVSLPPHTSAPVPARAVRGSNRLKKGPQ